MMKRKLLVGSITGLLVLGGAIGAGAASNTQDVGSKGKPADLISTGKAEEIAIEEVGGKLKSIELEKEDGHFVYDIELMREDNQKIDLEINAGSGRIIKVDRKDGHDDDNRSSKNQEVTISLDDAISAATKDTPGKVKEAELDDDGYYEIELVVGLNDVEMKIDSNSGKIIEKETDTDND